MMGGRGGDLCVMGGCVSWGPVCDGWVCQLGPVCDEWVCQLGTCV